MRSLDRLVQVQGDFEASVKDVLEGLDGLWAQLEELHTRVTLTKEASRGLRDLASAQTDAEVSRCGGPSAVRWDGFYRVFPELSLVCNTRCLLRLSFPENLGDDVNISL